MHAISQIIERNLHRRETCESALWINPERDDSWRKARASCQSLELFSQDFGSFSFLQQAGADIKFSAFPAPRDEKYKWIIINLPRQKALLDMLLECAAGLLAEDGVLWLAGENKAGIKSADKRLKIHFGHLSKLDNARHCTLYEARKPFGQHAFDPLKFRQDWPLDCNHTNINISSYPGVFAHGRLDAGTALLLDALNGMELDGDILDFACGAGVIGACIAANHEETNVTLLDNSALALRAAEETLAGNHLKGSVLASNGLSELTDSFDLIVSNPPIHSGIRTDNRMSMRLLESVHEHVRPGGMLMMVANVHLPYEKWLKENFKRCFQRASNDNYKVILAKK